eukprot:scaffold53714_cov55-Phaeocystis_antarctica.AAC.1
MSKRRGRRPPVPMHHQRVLDVQSSSSTADRQNTAGSAHCRKHDRGEVVEGKPSLHAKLLSLLSLCLCVSVLFASSLCNRILLCRRTHGRAACASRLKQSHRRARYAAYLLLRLRVRSRSPSPILGHSAIQLFSQARLH